MSSKLSREFVYSYFSEMHVCERVPLNASLSGLRRTTSVDYCLNGVQFWCLLCSNLSKNDSVAKGLSFHFYLVILGERVEQGFLG